MKALCKHLAYLGKCILLGLSLTLIPMQSHARDVTFEWATIQEPLTGYKLYLREGTSVVDVPIILGKVVTHTLTGLSPDKTYYFYLTAYNQAGESGSSAIVSIAPNASLSAPSIISIKLN